MSAQDNQSPLPLGSGPAAALRRDAPGRLRVIPANVAGWEPLGDGRKVVWARVDYACEEAPQSLP